MFRVILVCLVIRIRDMLNYLKIIHFHRGKKYTYKFMVCRSLSSTLLPPAAINSSEISTTEYWTCFFFPPTLQYLPPCARLHHVTFNSVLTFFQWMGCMEQGTTSVCSLFDVPHRKFFSILPIGCFLSILSCLRPVTTVGYFCKLMMMRKVDTFPLLCNACSCREWWWQGWCWVHGPVSACRTQVCGAIKHIWQDHPQ